MKRFALALCLLLAGCGAAQPIRIADARVQLPVIAGRPGAAYFTITGPETLRLLAVASPSVERSELHDSMANGMARLEAVPVGDGLAFAPGGRHAMLFGIRPDIQAGDRILFSFQFDGATPVEVQVLVTKIGT